MAGAGAAAFLAGLLDGGVKGYERADLWDRARAREARDQQTHDLNTRDKELSLRDKEQAAELKQQVLNGEVEGIQPVEGVALPAGQQPSGAVTAPVGIGAGAIDSMTTTTQPPTRSFSDMMQAGAQSGPLQGVQNRQPMSREDRNDTLGKIALLGGDLRTSSAFMEDAERVRNEREDMNYAAGIVKDPKGKEAKELMGLVTQTSLPGIKVATDPDTGIATMQYTGVDGQPKAAELTGSNLMRLAVAKRKLDRGDASALSDIAGIDKELASAVFAGWSTQQTLAKFNNDAAKTASAVRKDAVSIGKTAFDMEMDRLRLAQEQRARDGAAAAAKAAGRPDAEVEAIRSGGISFKPAGADGKYVYEGTEIERALGDVVLDPKSGRPAIDPLSGKTQTVPNPDKVRRFHLFMQNGGYRDTNEALPKFLAQEAQGSEIEAAASNAAKAPEGAVQLLRQRPDLAQQFDSKYGAGAAAAVLRQSGV